MIAATPFRLNRNRMLLALISAAFAIEASAAAGRVEFAFGGASVTGADGRTRPATRGSELDTGDVVRTTDGRVQIRMTDGAYISLQPNTEWGIKNYRFEGKTDGTESAFYSLVKGAMRTVTGLVGRVNRNRYQVGTPTATVGIRGTGGLIQILPDGSTLVQGTSGIWFLANPSGSIDIPAGVSGLAPADPKQAPQETAAVPFAGPTPPPVEDKAEYVQGDQRTDTGEPVIFPSGSQFLVSGSGYAGVFAYGANISGLISRVDSQTGTTTFNSASQLTDFTAGNGSYTLDASSGFNVDFGTDGVLAWGRWVGTVSAIPGVSGSESYTSNQGLHYVVGVPTAQMPTTGTATYTMSGATQPTYIDSSGTAPGTFSGRLDVDFQRFSVGMNLNVAMPDGKGYAIGGSAQISGSTFSGINSFGQGTLVTSGSGGACSSGCNAKVDGFFAGTSAERAGLGYHINDPVFGKDVVGAAAFKK